MSYLKFDSGPGRYHPNCRCITTNHTPKKEKSMKMTTNRLMTLLAIHRGTFENELQVGTTPADLAHLVANGLIAVCHKKGELDTYSVSPKGHDLLGDLLDIANGWRVGTVVVPKAIETARTGPNRSPDWSSNPFEVMLTGKASDEEAFYMVANAAHEVRPIEGLNHLALKNPPRVLHGDEGAATVEAVRLATKHQGEKFVVLKAVSVHQQVTPVISRVLI